MAYHTLRLILGDQLNASHSWFKQKQPGVLYLLAELDQEAVYTRHHIQKICAFFAAMEGFANALQQAGHKVLYLNLDDTQAFAELPELLEHLIQEYEIRHFEYQRPDEYRLVSQLETFCQQLKIPSHLADTEHFLLPYELIPAHFQAGKAHKMDTFYRTMRKQFNLLMQQGKPLGGKWSLDSENRHSLKAADLDQIPEPLCFSNEVTPILERINRHDIPYLGEAQAHLLWPVSRQQSQDLLEYFCSHLLPNFGRFQDAMTSHSKHKWSLYHSRLSFALNTKMLSPWQVIRAAIEAYENAPDKISLAQIEGFVRQILGWREFIRGIYWANMPQYAELNTLDATRDLPAFFWNGETRMHCQREAISQSLKYAYAHHIQRLMVTGNFCLLAGIAPAQVDDWYLGIYIDAIEWVEMPNTRGMTQYADGGLLATKPYAASGNYINKMSDYCSECEYDPKLKTERHACPLNSLYWHFLHRHRDKLGNNPRVGMIYRNWDNNPQQEQILARAEWCLDNLRKL